MIGLDNKDRLLHVFGSGDILIGSGIGENSIGKFGFLTFKNSEPHEIGEISEKEDIDDYFGEYLSSFIFTDKRSIDVVIDRLNKIKYGMGED